MKKIKKIFVNAFGKIYDFFSKIPKKTYETCAIILLAALLVFDLGYHLVKSVSGEMETAPAKLSVLSETKSVSALLLRDEMPIAFAGERYLCLCEEGERVQVGTELVRVYAESTDPDDIASLEVELYLQKLLKDSSTARLEKLRDTVVLKIEGESLFIEGALLSGNLQLAARAEKELYALMFLRERLLGTLSLESAIRDNEERIAALTAKLGAPILSITSPAVGWFSSSCDGYETVLPFDAAMAMDQASLLALFEQTPQDTPKIKLILSYETYAVASVSEAEAREFSLNGRYDVTLDGVALDLTLQKTVFQDQSDKVALIFSTSALSKTVSLRRISPLSLTLKQHEGFKIPISAITSENGVVGVYILKGFRVEFREISMVYRDGNIAICESDFTPSAYRALAENDNVIIKGKDLYDGKIVSRLY